MHTKILVLLVSFEKLTKQNKMISTKKIILFKELQKCLTQSNDSQVCLLAHETTKQNT